MIDVLRPQETAERWRQAETRKVVARHQEPVAALDLSGVTDVQRRHPKREQIGHGLQPVGEVPILEPGRADVDAGVGTGLDQVKGPGVPHSGIGLKMTTSIHEKTTVLAPIPTPSDRITTPASSGLLRIIRHAWRSSAITVKKGERRGERGLGVGIGSNTVVFSWIEAVIFKPIPEVRDAGSFRLVEPRTNTGIYVGSSWLESRDLADRLQTMTDVLAFRMAPL